MKVVINSDFGGFNLSDKAIEAYAKRKNISLTKKENEFWKVGSDYFLEGTEDYFEVREIPRNDLVLVEVIEELGEKANGFCSSLKVVEIPEDVDWYVEEYDGNEWVAEKHRTWM